MKTLAIGVMVVLMVILLAAACAAIEIQGIITLKDWQGVEDYNPNLIMSDQQFTFYNSMTASQINDFLSAKGSVYANYTIPEYVSVPYPYLGGNWAVASVQQINSASGETYWDRTVAQLLDDECQSHHINPQVILAIMQKESSTVTQSNTSSTRMAWPLFYGFNETMASFGYDQATAESIAQDYGGVGQQIAYPTWNFRNKFDKWANGTYGDWHEPIEIDGATVYPESIATRLLYTYTPHNWNLFLDILTNWGWYNSSTEGLPAVIEIKDGTGAIVEIKNVILSGDGGFSFTTSLNGSYTAVAKAWHWLAKAEPITIETGMAPINFTLTNGDCNGDNGVDEIDYAILSMAWYQAKGDPGYKAEADLNGDEGIDELDYAILSNAWYTAGD